MSKRRLRWGLVLCLLVTAGIVVRPLRTWIDQAAVRSIVPDLQVESVQYYPNDSVVEMNGFHWSGYDSEKAWGIRAKKAWFMIQPEPLARRQFLCPRGTLEEPVLYLTRRPSNLEVTSLSTQADDAHSTESRLYALLDGDSNSSQALEDLAKELELAMDSPAIQAEVVQQVEDWIRQSRRIREQILRLASTSEHGNNPLREEEELRLRLQRMEALAAKQQDILNGMAALQGDVAEHCDNLMNRLTGELNSYSEDSTKWLKLESAEITKQVLSNLANENWKSITDYATIANQVAIDLPQAKTAEYERCYYDDLQSDSLFLHAQNLSASGSFVRSESSSPSTTEEAFRIDASLSIAQETGASLASEFSFSFAKASTAVAIRVVSMEEGKTNLELVELPNGLNEVSASDQTDDAEQQIPSAADLMHRHDDLLRIQATTFGDKIAGQDEARPGRWLRRRLRKSSLGISHEQRSQRVGT